MANLCPVCGKEIIQPPKTKTKRFCSGKCRGIWWHDNNADHNEKEKPVILCQYCGKAFHARWKSEMNRKFCSHDCYVRSRHSKSQGSVVAQEEERNIGWLSQARSTIEDTGIHSRTNVMVCPPNHMFTDEDTVNGIPDSNANVHTLDQGLELCRIAAELDIPINPEIMCAYTYMDMETQQAPRFEEYPEIYALQNGKGWSELTMDEICTVLRAYGAFVAEEILSTGCTVNNWNLGNEANYGFAGISLGLKTAVNPKLEKMSPMMRYILPLFAPGWLEKNIWQYDAQAYAAVRKGILSAYDAMGLDSGNVRFSTHIATVVFTPKAVTRFFNCMKENGYPIDVAGISYYPSAPALYLNKMILLKKTVTAINKECGMQVFIGEYSYPSGAMSGPFAGWNKTVNGYAHDQQGQAELYRNVVQWGKKHGIAGIRYWAPDFEGWSSMSMFEFSEGVGTAKTILENHKEILDDSY